MTQQGYAGQLDGLHTGNMLVTLRTGAQVPVRTVAEVKATITGLYTRDTEVFLAAYDIAKKSNAGRSDRSQQRLIDLGLLDDDGQMYDDVREAIKAVTKAHVAGNRVTVELVDPITEV